MQGVFFDSLINWHQTGFVVPLTPANDYDPVIFLWLVIFIFLSRSLSIVKKIGLPLVVGEILSGVILGDLHMFGIQLFQNTESNVIIKFLAELGAIILMFEIGLESKFSILKRSFKTGLKVAFTGTLFTFAAGYLVAELLIPNSTLQLNLLLGVITAATATGISAKTFKEMNILHTQEVRITLVASIIDELISIFCFAIISAMIIDAGLNLINLSISFIQVLGFFIFAAIFGQWITPLLTKWSPRIHSGINMKIGVLLTICLFFAWGAHAMGLATVVGAFIAGLILDEVYFKSFSKSSFLRQLRFFSAKIKDEELKDNLNKLIDGQEERTLEELLKPLSHVFVPVFFIYIGLMLNVEKLFQMDTLTITATLLGVSFIGRIISGYLVRGKTLNKLIIGLGMTPIGEAGLIFSMFGKNLGIINDTVFSAIVSTLVVAAIMTPILIKLAIKSNGIIHEN